MTERMNKVETCDVLMWQPPKFNLQFLLVLTTLIALGTALTFVQNFHSMTVIAVVMLTWLFGCSRTKKASLWIAAAIYLPFLWLLILVVFYPWNDYLWMWVGMWGHLIGLIPAKLMADANLLEDRETWIQAVAAMFTVLIFLPSVSVIRFLPKARWWIVAAVLALSSLLSLGCYRGFQM